MTYIIGKTLQSHYFQSLFSDANLIISSWPLLISDDAKDNNSGGLVEVGLNLTGKEKEKMAIEI